MSNSEVPVADWRTISEGVALRLSPHARVAQWARDERAEREAGFREEGSNACEVCERADTSGRESHPSWALCETCGICGECGHAPNCEDADPALAAGTLRRALQRHLKLCKLIAYQSDACVGAARCRYATGLIEQAARLRRRQAKP